MSHYDYTFKILLVGDASVGKESFTKRYCYNIFNPSERLTIGVDFHIKTIELNDRKIKLQIWDIGGEERFRFLLPTYCLGATAAFLLYDITNASTLDNISEWLHIVRQKGGPIPIMLVGSNLDLAESSRQVPRDYGIQIAEEYNLASFVEVSAKNNINVDEAFKVLTELILETTTDRDSQDFRKQSENVDRRLKTAFKINDYLELRLENGRSNIYVKGRLFNQCKYLLFNISSDDIHDYSAITSVDEAAEKLDRSMERGGSKTYQLSPQEEFWAHCSNLQAWYENDYDTRILHRNLAFPLLRALMQAGDKKARIAFKEQLALRLESGHPSVVAFLVNQGYLHYLTEEEVGVIIETPNFIRTIPHWFDKFKSLPKWFRIKVIHVLKDLKCPYCSFEIPNELVWKFLKGAPLRCELCYTDLLG